MAETSLGSMFKDAVRDAYETSQMYDGVTVRLSHNGKVYEISSRDKTIDQVLSEALEQLYPQKQPEVNK